MRVQHNIRALNTKNKLTENNGKLEKALQKLSSGFKINSAADDAAGLAISEKMRAQITGAKQAQQNIQDGISLVRTADGAMEEIHQMLNRGKELCMQAANGIYTDKERQSIQQELDSLIQEIDRIATSSNFNGIDLLQGQGGMATDVVITGSLPAWVVTDPSVGNGYMSSVYTTMEQYQTTDPATGNTITTAYPINHVSASFDFSSYTGTAAEKEDLKKGGFYFSCCTCSNHYTVKFTDGTGNGLDQSGSHYIYSVGIDNINTPEDLVQAIMGATNGGNPRNHFTKLTQDPGNPKKLIVYEDRSMDPPPAGATGGNWVGWTNPNFSVTASSDFGKVGAGIATAATQTGDPDLELLIGVNATETLKINLPNIIPADIGLEGLSVRTPRGALFSMDTIEQTIDYVSGERGRMGSYHNRLEHTFSNMGNYEENLTRAESVLRDTDMAEEMAALTKEEIIKQAATAMLAQANQQPQQVLELLR